mmetsp:Transcript_30006/g.71496  ORF Transcript_30006/g.71496 Transcript_30006/m.71496 type:complete len:225 (-) Transcript_30006:748-1422(-)
MIPYTHFPSLNTRSQSTSGPSRYSSRIMSRQIHPPALPPASSSPSSIAPATIRADLSSLATRVCALASSSKLLQRMTPRDAAPWMGLSTAGKPTWLAASSSWAASLTRKFFGVGSPAFCMIVLVLCLLRALSTASHEFPGSPKTSERRDASGTATSQKVRMPSTSPRSDLTFLMASMHASKLASTSLKSTGMNFSTIPSSTSVLLQLSSESRITERTPSSFARS